MAEVIRPFDNGTQFADWRWRNCERCAKQWNGQRYFCEIELELDNAYLGNGKISEEIARRMGLLDDSLAYTWDCPERVLNESVESFNNAEPY